MKVKNMVFDEDAFAKNIEKIAGPSEESAEVKMWLDTGFAPLNYAISNDWNGGLPVGRIVEISGPESSGKTAIATAVMKEAQKKGGYAVFHDHERSFSTSLGEQLGLNVSSRFFRMRKPKTYEESLDNFVATAHGARGIGLPFDAPMVFVFDSLASMIPRSQLDKDMSKQGMHDQTAQARATSATFRVIANTAEETNSLVIFLNQVRQNIGVIYGDKTTTPGGNAPKFYASVRLQLSAKKLWNDNNTVVLGQEVTGHCIKNKVNRPFLKATWRYMFNDDGTGHFDSVGGTLDFMIQKGILQQNGAWVTWPEDGKKYQRVNLLAKIEASGGESALRRILSSSSVQPDVEVVNEAVMETTEA